MARNNQYTNPFPESAPGHGEGKGEVDSLLRQCKNCLGNQEQFNMIDCDDCKVCFRVSRSSYLCIIYDLFLIFIFPPSMICMIHDFL